MPGFSLLFYVLNGAVMGKYTVTALQEIQEHMNNSIEEKQDTVILAIEQSLAYNLVSYKIFRRWRSLPLISMKEHNKELP